MTTPTHSSYIPIRVDEFTVGLKTPVDLYVRVGDDDFAKLYSSGEKTESQKIIKYSNKAVGYLWVKNEQYSQLTKHNVLIAGIALKSEKYSIREKSRFVTAANSAFFNEIASQSLTPVSYNEAKQVSEVTVSLIQHHADLYELMENLSKCSDHWVKFSISVSAISVIIANGMGWKNPITMEKLAIGGMLHKLGFIQIPSTITQIPQEKMTPNQMNTFKSYPSRGAHLLTKIGIVPDDIVSIVSQHQERPQGKGFPKGISDVKIHPMARVVGLAEEFCRILVPLPGGSLEPVTPDQAFKILKEQKESHFNKEVFDGLAKMMGRNSLNRVA